ncbi:MAG TPA: MerR family transcriptional regulator [Gemmatimonadaceae bacterium]|nr:MerR family transcriptional regulator [Gemmatimonadaceae bacterium]
MLNLPNNPHADPIDLLELSDKAGISPRTIRYYIQQGLLPAPETRGPGAHYGPEHVDRLKLIRRLQREHLPLSEIRKRIEKLSPQEVKRILTAERERRSDSASEYVRRVLSEGAASYASPERRAVSVSRANLARDQSASTYQRSQWERFALAPDVELHIRRPVSREDNRRIERLLEAAREIFNEE